MTPREIDALVAEKVLGWTGVEYDPGDARTMGLCHGTPPGTKAEHINDVSLHGTGTGEYHIPRYSTTGDGLLLVVEAMRGKGWGCQMTRGTPGFDCWANFFRERTNEAGDTGHGRMTKELPLAVSLAALKALGTEVS